MCFLGEIDFPWELKFKKVKLGYTQRFCGYFGTQPTLFIKLETK